MLRIYKNDSYIYFEHNNFYYRNYRKYVIDYCSIYNYVYTNKSLYESQRIIVQIFSE